MHGFLPPQVVFGLEQAVGGMAICKKVPQVGPGQDKWVQGRITHTIGMCACMLFVGCVKAQVSIEVVVD